MNLLEAAVAAALVAILGVAALGASASALHAAGGNPVRDALRAAARNELRMALDVLKYQGATLVSRSATTALPLPSATTVPVRLDLAVIGAPDGSTRAVVTATALASGERVTLAATLAARAPLPGSTVIVPALAPAPTGAP